MNLKNILIFLTFFSVFNAEKALSQDIKTKFIGLETGINFVSCWAEEKPYMRSSLPAYGGGYLAETIHGIMNISTGGLMVEKHFFGEKLGVSVGAKYSRIFSSVGKQSYYSATTEYFYLLYNQTAESTEYLKVKEITEKTDYVGVPVEIRIFPFNQKKNRLYYKVGFDFNYNINTKHDVIFYDSDMEIYQDGVSKIAGEPNTYFTSLYLAAGVSFGKINTPRVNFEIYFPGFLLSEKTSTLVEPTVGKGFQLTIQLPF
jgi:hypothetical protein